jgi:hypothetical protein
MILGNSKFTLFSDKRELYPLVSLNNPHIPIPEFNVDTQRATVPAFHGEGDIEVASRKLKRQQLPLLTTTYIGSLTVVGLFMLFRMIQKSK